MRLERRVQSRGIVADLIVVLCRVGTKSINWSWAACERRLWKSQHQASVQWITRPTIDSCPGEDDEAGTGAAALGLLDVPN